MVLSVTAAALLVAAAPAELNRVGIAPHPDNPGLVRIFESSDVSPGLRPAPVEAREPCRVVTAGARAASVRALHAIPTLVECPARPAIVATLADGNDSFANDPAIVTDDRIDGAGGADVVISGPGRDVISGGPGNDTLGGGLGADRLDGGPGADSVRYDIEPRRLGVTATILGRGDDGSAEDGAPGARDVLTGIEHLVGSDHADRLTGDARKNTLEGGTGNDVLAGGAGADALLPGRGEDRVLGGGGDDVVEARDGRRDRITCGRGDATIAVDGLDRARGCATVAVATAGTVDIPVRIAPRARRTASGAVRLTVRCVAAIRCTGHATLSGGRTRIDIAARRTRVVAIRPRRRPGPTANAVVVTDPGRSYAVRTIRRVRLVRGAAP